MVDFLPEQHIVVRTEDAQVAETLADVNTCYWNEAFHEITSHAGQHPDAGIDMRVKYAGKRQGRTHPAQKKRLPRDERTVYTEGNLS